MSETNVTTQQRVNSVMAGQASMANNRLMSQVSDAFNVLVTEYEYQKLPESLFVEHFLPLFCGHIKSDTPEGMQLLKKWVIIARDNLNEVSIISNETGEILFNVPPLNSPDVLDIAHNKDKKLPSIDDLLGLAESLSNTVPARGANFFARAMDSRTDIIAANPDTIKISKYTKRWQEIFERYNGIIATYSGSIATNTVSINDVVKPKSNISEDELEDAWK